MKSLQKEAQTKLKPYIHIYPVDINYYPRIYITDVIYTDGYWVWCNGCQQNVIKYYTFIFFVTYTACLFPRKKCRPLCFIHVLHLSSKFKPQKQQNFVSVGNYNLCLTIEILCSISAMVFSFHSWCKWLTIWICYKLIMFGTVAQNVIVVIHMKIINLQYVWFQFKVFKIWVHMCICDFVGCNPIKSLHV
jgi:hypothetical protein